MTFQTTEIGRFIRPGVNGGGGMLAWDSTRSPSLFGGNGDDGDVDEDVEDTLDPPNNEANANLSSDSLAGDETKGDYGAIDPPRNS